MSIERWLAICYPMKAQYVNTTGRARRTAILMWLVSFILAIPTFWVVVSSSLYMIELRGGEPCSCSLCKVFGPIARLNSTLESHCLQSEVGQ
jgi:uncharacterized membrane protein YhaH (DUF805 family)